MENSNESQLHGKSEQQTKTLCKLSQMDCDSNSNCHLNDKNRKNSYPEVTDPKKGHSLKISSVLDAYCKTGILDESDDFMDYELSNKPKNGPSQKEDLLCEICKENITHLELHQRELHVNNCIDKQISSSSVAPTQAVETDNVFILECPLCFKHFSTPEIRSNHIKKCGRSKGLSTQSIIKALELQERHVMERISLGLPAKPLKPPKPKNPSIKRTIVEPKNKAEMDIQLAKALSLSLSSQKEDIEISENITTVALKPPAAHQRPGKKTKKNLLSPPLLVLRSEEDRKKLLLEKVASILTPMNTSDTDSPAIRDTTTSLVEQNKDAHEVPILWQLSSKASEKHDYYVEQMLCWIKPSDVETGAKLFHLSQIPGHEIVTQLPCDYTFSTPEENNQTCVQSLAPPTTDSDSSDVMACLYSLVASSWMSDVDIYLDCRTVIPAHKLLLALRCPPLKRDSAFCAGKDRVSIKWESVSFDAALQFLNFIYSGKIEIEDYLVSDLFYLANKYEVFDLLTVLHTKNKQEMCIESNKKSYFNNVDQPHLLKPFVEKQSFYSEPQTAEDMATMEYDSQTDTNADLEIVYNCINSSLKPSQSFYEEPPPLEDTISFKSSEEAEEKEHCAVLPMMVCSDSKSRDSYSEKAAIDVGLSSKENPVKSPEIFDVNDSEDDANDSSDNENDEHHTLSQKVKQSYVDSDKLGLSSSESNNSEESVKFLHSSYTSFNNLPESPEKVDNYVVSSPEFGKGTSIVNGSPLALNILSPEFLKFDSKQSETKAHSYESKEHAMDHCDEIERPSLSSSEKLDFSFHSDDGGKVNDIREEELPFTKEFSNCSILNPVTKIISPVKNKNSEVESSLSSGEPFIYEKHESSQNSFRCEDYNSPVRNVSPEVLICDSDSDSNVQESNFCERLPIDKGNFNFSPKKTKKNSPCASPLSYRDSLHSQKEKVKSPCASTSLSNHEWNSVGETKMKFYATPPSCKHKWNFEEETKANSSPIMSPTSPVVNSSTSLHKTFDYFDRDTFFANESVTDLQCSEKPQNREEKKTASADDSVSETNEPCCSKPVTLSSSTSSSLSTSSKKVKKLSGCKSKKNAAVTPSTDQALLPKFVMSDSPITPFPDFKSMKTPEIRQALKRIGVKALPRKKAVNILTHIYNETHPMVNLETNTECSSQLPVPTLPKESKTTKSKKRKNLEKDKTPKKQQKVHSSKECMLTSQESEDSGSENPEWVGCVPEITFSQSHDSPTKLDKDDTESVKQYIQSNNELYEKVLLYKPLNLVELHQELKNNSIKISIQKLMDFLDEQCITFTCPRNEEYQKKKTARMQRFRKNMIAKMSQQPS